jgi:hypothetical protein
VTDFLKPGLVIVKHCFMDAKLKILYRKTHLVAFIYNIPAWLVITLVIIVLLSKALFALLIHY